jgi:hypothetical protein
MKAVESRFKRGGAEKYTTSPERQLKGEGKPVIQKRGRLPQPAQLAASNGTLRSQRRLNDE